MMKATNAFLVKSTDIRLLNKTKFSSSYNTLLTNTETNAILVTFIPPAILLGEAPINIKVSTLLQQTH
jgi:hypothetical protein